MFGRLGECIVCAVGRRQLCTARCPHLCSIVPVDLVAVVLFWVVRRSHHDARNTAILPHCEGLQNTPKIGITDANTKPATVYSV